MNVRLKGWQMKQDCVRVLFPGFKLNSIDLCAKYYSIQVSGDVVFVYIWIDQDSPSILCQNDTDSSHRPRDTGL